jgi:hypothetical protein
MRVVALACVPVLAAMIVSVADRDAFGQWGDPPKVMTFSGLDLWRNGGLAYSGLIWSPATFDKSGFALKLFAGGGVYRYQKGPTPVVGNVYIGDVLPGWRFKGHGVELSVFGGLDIQRHKLTPDDLSNDSRGTRVGGRVSADLWWEPLSATMFSAGGSYATIGHGYWSRVATGLRAFDTIYVGPEALAIGNDTYRQWRAGAHATALKFGPFEFSAGVGYVRDSDNRAGVYGRFDMLVRM